MFCMDTIYSIKGWEGFYGITKDGRVWSCPRIINTSRRKAKIKGRWLKPSRNGNGYLQLIFKVEGREKTLLLHRILAETFLGCVEGKYIDHIDGDISNNSLDNLRICTIQQNNWNSKPTNVATSKYKGVSWNKNESKWKVSIAIDGKQRHLGTFADEVDAAKAYEDVAKEIHGEYFRSSI